MKVDLVTVTHPNVVVLLQDEVDSMVSKDDDMFLDVLSMWSTDDHIMYVLKDSILDGGFILEPVIDLLDALFSVKGSIREDFFESDLFWRWLIRSVREQSLELS